MNDYQDKIDRIESVLGTRPKISDKRRFVRYEHGYGMRRGKRKYLIKYQWTKPYSHYATGTVYDAVLGVGDDFDSALADAISAIDK